MDLELIQKRFVIGWERYGCGLLHPKNDYMNFKKELIEELVDMCIYASADAIRKMPQASATLHINDDGNVALKLSVNYELTHDGNDAVFENIIKRTFARYEYCKDSTSLENKVLDLGLFALNGVLNLK